MSNRSTGNEAEVAACRILEGEGWRVWRPSAPRFFKEYSSADIFGWFDILAVKDGALRWIQVKSEQYTRKKTIEGISSVVVPGTTELWLYHNGAFRIIEVGNENKSSGHD